MTKDPNNEEHEEIQSQNPNLKCQINFKIKMTNGQKKRVRIPNKPEIFFGKVFNHTSHILLCDSAT
jgi:hypothetical protein